ncbi:MAG: efflux RND transporter permease subunit [Phenylobacterium sp.]|uniref:efflux RND transporter permease subunit n=2 Tax=Phenylobacterium sp. TaxID=1871053 RepID=UPI0025E6D921|nr:efflux RND transporter permease subunit [Phenylobacterium sp.]MCA3724630.1 efflux RND transporter permease subunit [Phenylobacterium sp.]MCA3739083.1 efflux RND transporter permease subunit [Phenylobacterium sp.]MCA3750453.1 efflux RND transporter permease subunit [Phenylobacterium sp.]MCA4915308.1 efflux RND transporter permease subunit [Phenylobacterium sp.]MCA6240950.1 efflux RND transporter permease subunit [Phenylobacterium sp.]
MIGALIEGAIKRRKVVLGVTLIASIFGLIAYNTMPREANPNIDLPFVAVIVPYPGVSPEDAERLLVKPLETNLQSIEGVKQMNAVARQGSAFVTLEFEPDFDKDRALEDVRAKVDLARGRFPPDAEEAIVQEANFTDQPVIGIVLSGAAPEREFVRITNALRDRLESLPGVLQADVSGAREEFLEVTVDPIRMEAYKVTSGELAQVIARNNQLVPAGDMLSGSGRFAVKVPGVIEKPEDILSLPIKRNGDRLVTVGDIGDVRRTFKDPTFIARYNGEAAYSVLVSKRSGANVLDTVKAVRKTVEAESKAWPSTVKVDYTFDESEFIERTLLILEGGLLSATLLVMVIIVASLGVRQGLMVGMAIPACFALAFMMLNAIDVTLNQMVMFGLVLAVGILVDGGIVVVEYAERKMAEGMSRLEAFSVAGTRMFWPVLNGTLTTLCAFVPFMFWNSIPGKFMSFLPLTLFFVLGASIFIALIFTPALGSIFAKERKADAEELAELEKSERGDPKEMKGFMGWYARTVDFLSHHPFRVLAATFAIVIAIFVWFASTPHRVEFFLDEDPESVQVYVKARGNLNAQAQDDLVRQVEARVLGMQGVRALYVRSGNSSSFGGGRFGAPNDTIGTMEVEFLKYEDRVRLGLKGGELAAEVRRRVADIPGIETEVREPEAGPPTGKAIQVELRSNNPAAINAAADLIKAKLSEDRQIIELEDNRTSPGIEWNLAVDREAAGRFGVDVLTVGQAIQYTTTGVLVGRFRPDDAEDELDIRVRFTPDGRNLDALDSLKIGTPFGPVPASYFVDRQPAQQVTQIQRRDGQRLVVIQANVPDGVAANQKIADLRPWLEKAPLDASVKWKFTGADEEGRAAVLFFITAIFAALFMMMIILLWQFNSFWGVAVTLFAVLLSTVGVLLGVVVNVANTFNYISVIMLGTGVVALAGVVVGHNIVLVDSFYQLRRAGYNAHEAAVRSAAQRFRPVMLTTLVTVVGLLPLMFQFHPNFHNLVLEYQAPGSGQWVQLSAAVVWGLSFATLLTLILTPVMLAMPKVLSERFANVFDMIRRRIGLVARKRAYEGIRIPQGGPEAPSPTPAE